MRPLIVAVTLAVGLAAGAAMAGCADDTCDGATADALYLTVVDATTAQPVDATLSLTRDGTHLTPECIQRHATASPCELWAAGYMTSGTFEIIVAAPGYVEARETVMVAWGACGPLSQSRTFALVASPPPPSDGGAAGTDAGAGSADAG